MYMQYSARTFGELNSILPSDLSKLCRLHLLITDIF